ncbi:MAG: hypothetical protein ACM31C_02135 [Acidobacteriota bacterium]
MGNFELLGSDEDETRLLRAPAFGYSIVLAGHPRTEAHPEGSVKYDAVIALRDVAVHHGFRIDTVPAQMPPQDLAVAFVTAYRNNRATTPDTRIVPLPFRPDWLLGGAETIYPLRDVAGPAMEQVFVMIRKAPTGLWVLFHTTWFRNADVNNLCWAHLRASFIDQHAWDEKPRDTSPQIWPPSTITLPSAKLGLTDDAWKEATAKAGELPKLTSQQVLGLAAILREFAQSNRPPCEPVPELVLDTLRIRLKQVGPPEAIAVLVRNLGDCKTRHDLHGWAWQCTWALGNIGYGVDTPDREPDRG